MKISDLKDINLSLKVNDEIYRISSNDIDMFFESFEGECIELDLNFFGYAEKIKEQYNYDLTFNGYGIVFKSEALDENNEIFVEVDEDSEFEEFKYTLSSNKYIGMQNGWKKKELSLEKLAILLSTPTVGEKDGTCFTQGEILGEQRTKKSFLKNSLLILDFDSGQSIKEVEEKLNELNLRYIIYTTYSHLADRTEILLDNLTKIDSNFNEETVSLFLKEKKGWVDEFCQDVRIENRAKPTKNGTVVEVSHKPIEKFRVVLFLNKDYYFQSDTPQSENIDKWVGAYKSFIEKHEFRCDSTGSDVNRAFYFPRIKNEYHLKDYYFNFNNGDFLNLDSYFNQKKKIEFEGKKIISSKKDKKSLTTSEIEFQKYLNEYSCISIENIINDYAFDIIGKDREEREVVDEKTGNSYKEKGFHITCPFEEEHSTVGGSGTFVADKLDGFVIHCCHDSCQNRKLASFVAKLFEVNDIPLDEVKKKDIYGVKKTLTPAEQFEYDLSYYKDRYKYLIIGGSDSVYDSSGILNNQSLTNKIPEESKVLKIDTFKRFAHKSYKCPETGKVKNLADTFLISSNKDVYYGFKFDPSTLDRYIDNNSYINTYQGFNLIPAKKDWNLLKQHIFENLLGSNEEYYAYFITFLADILQNPEDKKPCCLIMQGEEGVGKSFLFELFGEMVLSNNHYLKISKPEDLFTSFNNQIKDKLLIIAEEAFFAGNKGQSRTLLELVSGNNTMINKKFQDSTNMDKVFFRLVINTNDRWVVSATDKSRRWLVFDTKNAPANNHKFIRKVIDQLQKEEGMKGFMHYLLDYKPPFTEGFNALYEPVKTEAFYDQVEYSYSKLDDILNTLKSNKKIVHYADKVPDVEINRDGEVDFYALHKICESVDRHLTKKHFIEALKRHGFKHDLKECVDPVSKMKIKVDVVTLGEDQ